jgi:SAM-dependent methyltransferase
MTDSRTIALYNAEAAAYADQGPFDTDERAVQAFMAHLPARAHILDLGCGPGYASRTMAQAGHTSDPVDASQSMVDIARALGLPARLGRFDDLNATQTYDGVWANFSLLHARRDDFPHHLSAIHRALKPGGLFHIGMKLGRGEARDQKDRYYSYYSLDELTEHLRNAGFAPFDTATGSDPGFDGTVSPWAVILSRA